MRYFESYFELIFVLFSIVSTVKIYFMRQKANQALAPTRVRLQTNNCIKKVRWTKEDDELLFRLLKDVDNPNWPFIAKYFPGKVTQQVTERWEKVLNPKLIKGSWTREEDQTIINFVAENGSKNWKQLATLLPGRIGKQCRERWRNHLDPAINHSMWTSEEDFLLISLHETFGNAWVKISQHMPGRSDNAIKNRWNSTLKKVDPKSFQLINQSLNGVQSIQQNIGQNLGQNLSIDVKNQNQHQIPHQDNLATVNNSFNLNVLAGIPSNKVSPLSRPASVNKVDVKADSALAVNSVQNNNIVNNINSITSLINYQNNRNSGLLIRNVLVCNPNSAKNPKILPSSPIVPTIAVDQNLARGKHLGSVLTRTVDSKTIDQNNKIHKSSPAHPEQNSGETGEKPVVETGDTSSTISFVSPFKNLISPGIQKTAKETSPRAATVESNRQKFLVLLEREDKNEKNC
ncbi:hypothetical protein TRFO_11536 [Tritrichomonas foetus]|uniref:Myb-like DNA-binding domain containing protein n=1 Tax=Tritrichomonas foetus TaxID=1144522 RepID=A0A1J4J955_9EUKA|nr:hypothetical protein TRFO_11536 [Tritrichomonas foetus]|eukprot:OHS93756.1 hypothetical protein TRFO_11536 [Tritrichomonas foetus]